MLLAAGAVLHQIAVGARRGRRRRGDALAGPLLAVFGLALFTAWSPVDFWSLLPRPLHLAQFPYRLLTDVMWSGALLGALALVWLVARPDARHTAVGLLLIGLAAGPYLPALRRGRTVESVVQRPDTGDVVFLPEPGAFPRAPPSAPVRPVAETQADCRHAGPAISCQVDAPGPTFAQLPVLYYPGLLDVEVDGRPTAYSPSAQGDYLLAGVEVDGGRHEVRAAFSGHAWGNRLSALAWILTLAGLAAAWWRGRRPGIDRRPSRT
jgi:hypothetical protein